VRGEAAVGVLAHRGAQSGGSVVRGRPGAAGVGCRLG